MRIGKCMLGHMLELGREKFSSNVIEKCLEYNDPDVRDKMV